MSLSQEVQNSISQLDISLERDVFMRTLIRELSGTLQEIVGLEEASGFISVVGQVMGDQINNSYKSALQVSNLSREQVAQVLVDLKKRIQGDFYIIEEDDEKIVLGNRVCPFGEKVIGRPSMCMMTSNVFGSITASNLGYSKVELQETIAQGASGCRVVVYLKLTEDAEEADGREYFKS
ncbi:methanogen output domain 1-containing protein [Okeania sp.]|uniref:methanogen output domain 1-containing protein n=1 Tax=Okeania sp. TaxID=3100323 RepID=UPI002B4B772C|nr:methanogen output domain 1-containing protein [Okeania sp.]MEB3342435.1 methanogen output domain 1-containing protein [Okeania sp.]